MRSDRRPKWARRRAPEKGALLERWLAQCGVTTPTIHDRVIVRIRLRTGASGGRASRLRPHLRGRRRAPPAQRQQARTAATHAVVRIALRAVLKRTSRTGQAFSSEAAAPCLRMRRRFYLGMIAILTARMYRALSCPSVIVAISVLAELLDELDSRPPRTENSANSYSRPEPWRSTRLMLRCRMGRIVATLQLHVRSESFDRRLDRNSSSDRLGYCASERTSDRNGRRTQKSRKTNPLYLGGDRDSVADDPQRGRMHCRADDDRGGGRTLLAYGVI